ncbi:MEF2-activating motif and SAP domain-containing transcriptional regulator isoform X1 [Heterocephalus glaber]|uniref:MEF2-activating motif and SAP domain-containing transcriptional regulator n=1 Tax=Heterocephalus glaber TaxID=10181 RepID=A0AAX6Q3T1_HETGA|nr:MEF2-activating motif and SAP domain-containing transcriptional regulator isoform X1 [Heterocephalus glaber]
MTLAASSQRSQIIRSKFRSVLQLRIHRRNQDPTSDLDPWISAPGLALAPALPSAPAPFLFGPGVLLPDPERCPWQHPQQESPKVSPHWRAPKPQATLTYHQYRPPEQGYRARGEPRGPPPWGGTSSRQPSPRMKPTPLTPSPPGVSSPSPSPHRLELQTLKLEELTVSELRQQLRLKGLPVSGTKSMLLERMRSGAPPRELQKQRREGNAADTPWPRLRPKALGTSRRQRGVKANPAPPRPPLPHSGDAVVTAPAPVPTQPLAPVLTPSSAPAPADLTLEEELQEAIRRAQLLPSRGINDILEDQVDPDDLLPPIPLDFPSSFDVLSPSPDSEGLSVFSSSLQSLVNSPSSSPGAPTEALDWLEALSGGPPLGSGPPGPSIFSVDLSEFGGAQLWDLLEDPW